jgi:effector-binding domain-containing protein
MKPDLPHLETREKQNYVAVRSFVSMDDLSKMAFKFEEVFSWLDGKGLKPAGPPFYRYAAFEMGEMLDLEVGVPVAFPVSGDEKVQAGFFPEGQYAVLFHTGSYDGLQQATSKLLDWAEENGIIFQTSDYGKVWRARIEYYLIDPNLEPNPEKWLTELAILTV